MMNSTERKIKEISFAELFEGSFYVIPLYQRRYSWDKDNLNNLWIDIENIRNIKDQPDSPSSHFMSSVLVKESRDGGEATHHIVDGQQRITTAYLSLKAALDVLDQSAYKSSQAGLLMSERLQGLLYGKNYNFNLDELSLTTTSKAQYSNPRLTLQSQPDDHAFNVLVYKGASEWNATHFKSKVSYSYKFFYRKFDALLKSDTPMIFFSTINVIMNHLQMIYIPILPNEAPQKIFESVNGLTKKLYAGELIKNYLLMSMTNEEDSNRVYQKYWAEFDKPEWTDTDKNKELLTKMLYYWVCSRGFKAQKGTDEHIYRAFKQDAGLSAYSTQEAAKKAEKLSGSIYKSITSLIQLSETKDKPRTRLEKSYSRIYAVKDTTNSKSAFILFLQLIDDLESNYGSKLSEAQLDKLLMPLESYIVRKVLSSYGYSGRTSEHLVDLAHRVFKPEALSSYKTIDEYLEYKVKEFAKELDSGLERNRRFDSNASLFDSIVGSITKGIPPRQITTNYHDIVKMLLIQTENYLRTNSFNPNGSDVNGDVSVEHWLPQHSSPKDWPLKDEKDRALYTNTLGNLCIIPPRINSSLSNQSLENKINKVISILKQDGVEKTDIQTFDKVLDLCRDDKLGGLIWDEEKMEERAKWIMDIVLNKVFKDVEHFTGEERVKESESTKLVLWDNPVAGRRIIAKARQTIVRAYQQADGTLVIDEVTNMQPSHTSSIRPAYLKKREEFLKQSEKQDDGTYNWQGLLHSQNRTGLLTVIIGFPMSDVWKLENPKVI